MNKIKLSFIILIIFAFSGKAQIPISESNSFMYNKQNYGADLFNCFLPIQQLDDGKIVVTPYQLPYVAIGNTYAKQYLKNSKIIESGCKILKLNNKAYLFNNLGLYEVFPDGSSKKIVLLKKKFNYYNVVSFKNKIWILLYDIEKRVYSLYTFNGKDLQLIQQFFRSKDNEQYIISLFSNQLYLLKQNSISKTTTLYTINETNINLVKEYPFYFESIYFKNIEEIVFNEFPTSNKIYCYNHGKISLYYTTPSQNQFELTTGNICFIQDNFMNILSVKNSKPEVLANIYNVPPLATSLYNKETNSYYLGTGNNFYRLFPYIKKYPKVFNNQNSQTILSLSQAKDGKIWAGSYSGRLAFIDKDRITTSPLTYSYMNYGKCVGNKMILNTEYQKGILLFDDEKQYKTIVEGANSYTNFISSDSIFYISDAFKGIQYAPWKDVIKGKANWHTISKQQGLIWNAVDDFVEDKYGNIWGAKNKRGVFVYQPAKYKAIVWDVNHKKLSEGSIALLVDKNKTIWMATNSGKLLYYDSKSKDDLSVKNFHGIIHPLLQSGKMIYSIHQWNDYLVLGASDKILLFDLKKWYNEKKVLVRYLNPMETSFTTNIEQHTILTDFRDQSIWFSTSDMLYQWNIKKWLELPVFKVNPKLIVQKDTLNIDYFENKLIPFKPRENSLVLQIDYQSKDNMPRFINATLVKECEKPIFESPNLQTKFTYYNLNYGEYVFYVRICQQDGSFTIHKFPIEIEKFFWQNWWFWCLISLFPIGVAFYYFRNKKQMEQQKTKIAQLNVSTLSNQFRPHFMLNALNSLGTELDDKPHAEKVISRIGENINLMYGYSQKGNFYILFSNEWKLVENTIEIQRLIFIKELQVVIENAAVIPETYYVPMGIIQVCVENALLHGIRHRKIGPYQLQIKFSENETFYFIEIIDNGVGRARSASIYNFIRNGTGLKNINSLIKIINSKVHHGIALEIFDTIYKDKNYPGTKIKITFLKNINYEIFKL